MVDKETIRQILVGLMKNPLILSQTDKYYLTVEDFTSLLDKYIFSSIYNLYKDGAKKIEINDIDNYLIKHPAAQAEFKKENGIEYLIDAFDFVQEGNFDFYYKRLKKFNALEDLKRISINTPYLYSDNLLDLKSQEINDNFEKLEVSDIFNIIKEKIGALESKYKKGDAEETIKANKGIKELLQKYKESPEVGNKLQGDIFNSICRGARKGKFYIRSAESGTGKTRASLGDACYLAYPIRFNPSIWKWESTGSAEKTLFIATEQDYDEIQTLVLAYLTGFNEEKILYGNYTKEEEKIILQASEIMDYFQDNFLIERMSNPNILKIKAVIRENWLLHNIQNVFYDYIFSGPSLLEEFRDLRIREDVALGMLSTALKEIAVELKIFVMSSTQTNAKTDDSTKKIKNANVIRGSRAIVDKCDLGVVIANMTDDESELLKDTISVIGKIPNQVMDIYKNRRGKYNNVKVWSYADLGTCRKEDLFITNDKYQIIDNFEYIDFIYGDDNQKYKDLLNKYNNVEKEEMVKEKIESKETLFEGLL